VTTLIHDTELGVVLRVEYHIDGPDVVFDDIRVLDTDYRPVGPDVKQFLDGLFLLLVEDPPTGEKYLSIITGEILNEQRSA
jgi:hypothetical protein